MSTADGVPGASNADPTTSCLSSSTGELRPISRLASSVPVETIRNFGVSLGGLFSQALRSGSIFRQNPHSGSQKSTTTFSPLKLLRERGAPLRSGSSIRGGGLAYHGSFRWDLCRGASGGGVRLRRFLVSRMQRQSAAVPHRVR